MSVELIIDYYLTMSTCLYIFVHLVTSDVQSVNATVVGESTIDIQCWFIHGSDALGCKVVLVSDYPNVDNAEATFLREDISAFGQFYLTHEALCYQRVHAYSVDINSTLSTLHTDGNIITPAEDNDVCSGTFRYYINELSLLIPFSCRN